MKKLFFIMPIFCLTMLNIGANNMSLNNPQFKSSAIEKKNISPKDKIVFENCNNVFMSTDSEVVNESLEKQYSLTVKLNYEAIQPNYFETEEEKRIEFERLKAFHTSKNELAIQNIDFSNFDEIYVSKYAPYVSIDTSYESIANNNFNYVYELAENDNVEMIYVNEWDQEKESLDYTRYSVGARKYILDGTYDGTGVTVGILEIGIPDKSSVNLVDKDIKIRDVWNAIETKKEHTTIMASVIGGKNGFAPKCALRCAQLFGDPVAEVDWMMDKGATIINCSFGESEATGCYGSDSAYFDYIARLYKVLFVCASGNFGETNGYVTNPGLGYNVLTVGSCSIDEGRVSGFSSSVEIDGPRKPDIVAPGYCVNVQPYGSQDGTSISAAVTSGVAALIMQFDNYAKLNPVCLIPALTASALNKSSGHSGNGFNDYAGTGEIDFANYLAKIKSHYVLTFTKFIALLTPYNITLKKGDKLRYAAWWPAFNEGKVEGTTITNYDIYVYDSEGNVVCKEETLFDNKEFLEFTAPSDGTYCLGVQRRSVLTLALEEECVYINYTIN